MAAESEFIKFVEKQVSRYETSYRLKKGQAFMLWYALEGLEMDEDSAYEAVSVDRGNDKSIDFFYVDEEYERVVIGQGKYSARGVYNPKPGEFWELAHSTDWLRNPEQLHREGRSDLAVAGEEYLQATANGYGTEYLFVYFGSPKKDISDVQHQFNTQEAGNIPARSARVIHLPLLRQMHDEYIDKKTRITKDTIRIVKGKGFEQVGAYGKALIATLPGRELRGLYERHGDALFDRNIRLFLGARKGGVNAGIRDTLTSATERKNFWAYNNGLTFVCDDYSLEPRTGKLQLTNFSIVNGCQTTVSVANTQGSSDGEISLSARFISSPHEQVVDSIIRFTNAQTPIRPWDITSQDKTQKALKKEFTKEPHPYFYELRRGEMRRLSRDERRRFMRNGKLQVITYDLLAQYLAALKGLPSVAYKDKGKLFTTYREVVLPQDLRVEHALLGWLSGEAAEQAVRNAIKDAVTREDQQEIRILKRGGKMFVLSIMGLLLSERNGATFLSKFRAPDMGVRIYAPPGA
jgi:hypothetical protein